jgi:hypothetical protein
VLYRIASEIESLVDEHGAPPAPVRPETTAVRPQELADDTD